VEVVLMTAAESKVPIPVVNQMLAKELRLVAVVSVNVDLEASAVEITPEE
jgi:hypothetical protein